MFDNFEEFEQWVITGGHGMGSEFSLKLEDRVVKCRIEQVQAVDTPAVEKAEPLQAELDNKEAQV